MDDLDRFERAVIEFFQQIALPQAQRDAPNTEWWSTCAAVADSPASYASRAVCKAFVAGRGHICAQLSSSYPN